MKIQYFRASQQVGNSYGACAEPLRAERANRIGRENGGILRYGVKFLNLSSILPSSGGFFYHGKHILLKMMVDS